jgi:hypothetical protein
MVSTRRARAALDLASGVLGLLAGLFLVVAGTVGLPRTPGFAFGVTAMGLLGAGFSAVGVGHVAIDDRVRGGGEFVAGAGAILLGLAFGVGSGGPLVLVGGAAVVLGGAVVVADSFGLELPVAG